METIYLTKEEIDQIKSLQNQENNLISELGQLEYQLLVFKSNKSNLESQIFELREESTRIISELQEKYGDGEINIASGEFIKS